MGLAKKGREGKRVAEDWHLALPREIVGADVQSEEKGAGTAFSRGRMGLRVRPLDGRELSVKGTGISVVSHVRADWGKEVVDIQCGIYIHRASPHRRIQFTAPVSNCLCVRKRSRSDSG